MRYRAHRKCDEINMSDEYSDEQLERVISTTAEWCEAFSKSAEFAALSAVQQRETGAITEFFAQYSYTHIGVTPEEWHPGVVWECCTEILPRKVSAEPAFFEAVAPVLTAFFNFLGARSMHRKGRELAKAVAGSREEAMRTAQDQSSWGPAKRFVMAAQEAGVDIQDPKALKAFMVRFNLQQVARFQPVNSSRPPWSTPDIPQPKHKKHTFPAPGSRYDPCPCGSGKKYKFCCDSTG